MSRKQVCTSKFAQFDTRVLGRFGRVELGRVDCLVSPLYRKRKLMAPDEAKEVLGMCVDECKRQATEAANSRDLRGEFMSWSNCAAVLEAAESQEYDLVLR